VALNLVSWFTSEKHISAGEGNASDLHLGLSVLSELLALWGWCPRATCATGLWLAVLCGAASRAALQPGQSCPLPLCLCLSVSAASALLLLSGHQRFKTPLAVRPPLRGSAVEAVLGTFAGSKHSLTHGQQVEEKRAPSLGEVTMDRVAPPVAEAGWH